MANDTTYLSGSNYEQMGGTVWVVGGTLLFDTTSATKSVVTGANLVFTGVPVADPHVAGALWANANVLTLSAG